MYKYLLQESGDINWMAIFALLTFVIVFGVSVYMIFRRDQKFIDHMANLPLEDEVEEEEEKGAESEKN